MLGSHPALTFKQPLKLEFEPPLRAFLFFMTVREVVLALGFEPTQEDLIRIGTRAVRKARKIIRKKQFKLKKKWIPQEENGNTFSVRTYPETFRPILEGIIRRYYNPELEIVAIPVKSTTDRLPGKFNPHSKNTGKQGIMAKIKEVPGIKKPAVKKVRNRIPIKK